MRILKDKKKLYKWIVILLILIALFLFCYFENHHLVTTTYTFQSEKIDSAMDGYRIVQISDFHNANFGPGAKDVTKKVLELQPDIIVITGDLVDCNHTNVSKSLQLVDQLVEICDVYYVSGNHEKWITKEQEETLYNGLKKSGVTILTNEIITPLSEQSDFILIGLDDNNLFDSTLKDIMGKSDKDAFSLVLAHEPQYFSKYAEAQCDLILSGHAHGGQFILPVLGPLVAPDQGIFPQYAIGEHVQNDTTMIISRGIGNSIIPIRLFNSPEIVCVDLQSSVH